MRGETRGVVDLREPPAGPYERGDDPRAEAFLPPPFATEAEAESPPPLEIEVLMGMEPAPL